MESVRSAGINIYATVGLLFSNDKDDQDHLNPSTGPNHGQDLKVLFTKYMLRPRWGDLCGLGECL